MMKIRCFLHCYDESSSLSFHSDVKEEAFRSKSGRIVGLMWSGNQHPLYRNGKSIVLSWPELIELVHHFTGEHGFAAWNVRFPNLEQYQLRQAELPADCSGFLELVELMNKTEHPGIKKVFLDAISLVGSNIPFPVLMNLCGEFPIEICFVDRKSTQTIKLSFLAAMELQGYNVSRHLIQSFVDVIDKLHFRQNEEKEKLWSIHQYA